jgi:hypothetical protein
MFGAHKKVKEYLKRVVVEYTEYNTKTQERDVKREVIDIPNGWVFKHGFCVVTSLYDEVGRIRKIFNFPVGHTMSFIYDNNDSN